MKRDNGFDKNPDRAREAGRKSKRTSFKTILAKSTEELKRLGIKDPDVLAMTSLLTLVQERDMRAVSEYFDRTLGKAKQLTELTGADGGAIVISPIAEAIRQARAASEAECETT